jgi:beta-aspartyl-peptidase (threonine type)
MRIRLDGFGGIIAISASGGIGLGFSTFRMPWAYRTADELHYGIDRDDHFVQKPGDPFDMPKVRYKGKR